MTPLQNYPIFGISDQAASPAATIVRMYDPDATTEIAAGFLVNNATSIVATHEADTDELMQFDGDTVCVYGWNDRTRLNITWIPFGSTRDNAILQLNGPATMALIAIEKAPTAEFGGKASLNTATNTVPEYIYRSGYELSYTNTGRASISMEVTRWNSIALPSVVT